MQFIVFISALVIVIGIGLWSRSRRQGKAAVKKAVERKAKAQKDYLEQHRRTHLRRVK